MYPLQPSNLLFQDLGVIRSIIDVASKEVRLKANEMEAVGKTFNKLDAFHRQFQKAEEEAKKANEGTTPAEALQRRQVMAPDKTCRQIKSNPP